MSDVQTKISIFLVDDESLVRAGLRALLEKAGSFDVVGESGDARVSVRGAGGRRARKRARSETGGPPAGSDLLVVSSR